MTPYEQELLEGKIINVNGTNMPVAIWNLLVSKRDLQLWEKGIKPTASWKVTDVKQYFGIAGNKESLVEQITYLYESYKDVQ